MIDFNIVRQAAANHWLEILPAQGIPLDVLNGKHQACAGCGGNDRFRYSGGSNGRWFCGQGGMTTGGDGFDLLVHVHGQSKYEALMAVADYLCIQPDRSPETRRKAKELAIKAKARDYEQVLACELQILLMVIDARIVGRTLVQDHNFQAMRPEYTPPPNDHWEREQQAAQRITKLIAHLYQGGLEVAA
ncbi:MAG: primase-helicase zinc-binding domain-containing protein [Candidatus Sedimenticola sp. (ex Thyasira tokunagai)]